MSVWMDKFKPKVVAIFDEEIADTCGNMYIDGCQRALVKSKAKVREVVTYMNQNPAPTCMQKTEALLKSTIEYYSQGQDLMLHAVSTLSQSDGAAANRAMAQAMATLKLAHKAEFDDALSCLK